MHASRSAAVALLLVSLAATARGQEQFAKLGKRFFPGIANFNAAAFADVDNDGDEDLVTTRPALYLGDGHGRFRDFSEGRMPRLTSLATSIAVGDVDGDNDPDIVFGTVEGFIPGGVPNVLLVNDGQGSFTDVSETQLPPISTQTGGVALADIDADGDLDLAFANGVLCCSYRNTLLVNDGAGRFTDVTARQLPAEPASGYQSVATVDVDGDGDPDLVFGNDGQNALYLNDGNGGFTDVTATHLPPRSDHSTSIATGDVDRDGDQDLVFGNAFTFTTPNTLLLNDGAGVFRDATTQIPWVIQDTLGLALLDVDEDLDLDLISGDSLQRHLYLNDGSGRFNNSTVRLPVGGGGPVAVADVDRDGDVDFVDGDLFLNLLRQVDTPIQVFRGESYKLDVYVRYGAAAPGDIAFSFLAPATASIPVPLAGTLFLDPSTMLPLPPLAIPQSGTTSLLVRIPNVPSLAGVPIFSQALIVRAPTFARFTNLAIDVIR